MQNQNYRWFKRRPSKKVWHFGRVSPVKALCGQTVVRCSPTPLPPPDGPPEAERCPGCEWRMEMMFDALFGPTRK